MDFKNARPMSQPAGAYNPPAGVKNVAPGRSVLSVGNVDGGLVTAIDPADISDNAFAMLKNFRYRQGKRCETRPGTDLLTPTKPNSNKVLGFYEYTENDGTSHFFRFTKNSIHEHGGSWT